MSTVLTQVLPKVSQENIQLKKLVGNVKSKSTESLSSDEKSYINFGERRENGILIHVDFNRLLAADLEWILRIADYGLQDVILEEKHFEESPEGRRPRVGRYFTPLSQYSFEIHYAKTEHSIDVLLILEGLKWLASNTSYDLLKKIFQKINKRLRINRLPLKSKATELSLKERRIKSIRISRIENGEVIESVEIIEKYQ